MKSNARMAERRRQRIANPSKETSTQVRILLRAFESEAGDKYAHSIETQTDL